MLFIDKIMFFVLPALLLFTVAFRLFSDEIILCGFTILYIIMVIYEIYTKIQTLKIIS